MEFNFKGYFLINAQDVTKSMYFSNIIVQQIWNSGFQIMDCDDFMLGNLTFTNNTINISFVSFKLNLFNFHDILDYPYFLNIYGGKGFMQNISFTQNLFYSGLQKTILT